MKSHLRLVWVSIRDSLWFIPAICTAVACVVAVGLLVGERNGVLHMGRSVALLYGGSPESAQALLSAVAGGLITVTGVVFSVMIVALELSSSQYTPRVLPNFMADRSNQLVIGVLIGTFTYCLLVLRAINTAGEYAFVPRIAISGGMLLALVSVATLIFFINHAAHSIQIASILDRATEGALQQVDSLFPEQFAAEDTALSPGEEPPKDHVRILAARSGYLQAVDQDGIFTIGREREAVVSVEQPIGAFILEGQTLARAWPADAVSADDREKLGHAFILGHERTRHQDYELTLIEISDVAVKALSPGINDPTTAQHCIDRLSQLLLAMARRHSPTRIRTREGRVHVIVKDLPFARAVESAFSQILHFGASNPAIREHLIERLDTLLELVPPDRRRPLADLRTAVRVSAGVEAS